MRKAGTLGLLAVLLIGCGYSATRLLPAKYQTIHVSPFADKIPITEEIGEVTTYKTTLSDLEERVTRGVINQFLFDGNLRVTTDPRQADLLLEGAILDFYRQDLRRADDDTVEEYRLNLLASVSLRDRDGAVIFEDPKLIGDTTYFVSGSLAKSETKAVDDLVSDFSKRIVERVIEYW